MPSPKDKTPISGPRMIALVGLSSAASIAALVATWEGKENVGYRDIVGVPTACYGDTNDVVVGKRYSDVECLERLDRQLAAHTAPVLRCTPKLADPSRRPQLIAAVSLAYNVGTGAYCRSTVDRRFDAGDWRGGCDALMLWNKAGGRVIRGLTRRRAAERAICVEGLPS